MKKFVLALLAVVLVMGLCTVAYAWGGHYPEIPEIGHRCESEDRVVTYFYKDKEVDPDDVPCGEEYSFVKRCTCGKLIDSGDKTSEHNKIRQIDRPECGATGSTYEYCTKCQKKFNEEYTAVKEHTKTAYVAATCTEDAYFYCPDCKQTVVEKGTKRDHHKVLPDQNKKAANCTEDGYQLWICDRPGCDWTELKNFPKLNHKDADGKDLHTIVEHTYAVENCVEGGKYLMKCQLCPDTIIKNVDPLDHAWTAWHIDEEATCEMKGFKSRICTRPGCQDLRNGKPAEQVEEIPALDHDIVYTMTKKPTCTAEGEEFGTCGRCEKTFTRPIAMVKHDFTEYTVVGGCKVRTCKVCHLIESCPECPADP